MELSVGQNVVECFAEDRNGSVDLRLAHRGRKKEAARRAGMSEAMFGELMAVVGMANETNSLANGYRVPIDDALKI